MNHVLGLHHSVKGGSLHKSEFKTVGIFDKFKISK